MTLTITAKGQVTLRKEVLQHLGISPGEQIAVELLPGHQASLKAAHGSKTIHDIFGMLAGETDKVATIDEINEATARGWAGVQ